ncbi:hypothetical protein [Rhabdochlamydiaceae symbiont of Dictyostelium giganteum]|uniref:hypothetical protein n=1 Tax=Rhabdochlamydiaceae symbiont of Dictyostelium giganteum TaxID=3342349 RepID=UPI00384F9D92
MMTTTPLNKSLANTSLVSQVKTPFNPHMALGLLKWASYSFCVGFIRSRGKRRIGARSAGYTAIAWVVYHLMIQIFHQTTRKLSPLLSNSLQKASKPLPAQYESAFMTLLIGILLGQRKVLRWHSNTSLMATVIPILLRSSYPGLPFVAVIAAMKKKKKGGNN